jgi:hypothetical protein
MTIEINIACCGFQSVKIQDIIKRGRKVTLEIIRFMDFS